VLEDLLALVGEREKDLCGISGELRQWLSAHARCGEAGIARGAESQVIRAHGSAC
jgi:hypothetical protein